jgi:hypothetical protein
VSVTMSVIRISPNGWLPPVGCVSTVPQITRRPPRKSSIVFRYPVKHGHSYLVRSIPQEIRDGARKRALAEQRAMRKSSSGAGTPSVAYRYEAIIESSSAFRFRLFAAEMMCFPRFAASPAIRTPLLVWAEPLN